MLRVSAIASLAFLLVGTPGLDRALAAPQRHPRPAALPRTTSSTSVAVNHHSVAVDTAGGASSIRVLMREPAGTILLFRVTAPRGARVDVTGVIPQTAGVSTWVPRRRNDPAETCRSRGQSISCTQGEEACPMPAATWRIRLRKAGRAGWVRVTFVVGPAKASRA